MTRVLGVVGSPRRHGNTDVLVATILEGAKAEGASVETVYLNGLTIRECDGCHTCWEGQPCSKKDDMNDLYPRITESDVIVFGTPVYWYGPTALMKGFIDRFVYFCCAENSGKLKGKLAILAVPFEETTPATADQLVQSFEKSFDYLGIRIVAQALVPGVTRKGEVREKKEVLEQAFEMGRRAISDSR